MDRRGWRGIVCLSLVATVLSCQKGSDSGEGGEAEGEPEEAATYVLARAGHRLPVGTVRVETRRFELNNASLTVEVEGEKKVGTMSSSNESVRKVEIVAEDFTRITVEKDAQRTQKAIEGLPQDDPPLEGALSGRTVIFQEEGGVWTGRLDGEEASEDQRAQIEAMAEELGEDESAAMFGTAGRRVGEEWEVDPRGAALLASQGEFTGRYTIRFERVEEYRGQRCAVLAGTIEVRRVPEDLGTHSGPEMQISGWATIYRSLDHFENLKSEMVGKLVIVEHPPVGGSRLVRGSVRILEGVELTLP